MTETRAESNGSILGGMLWMFFVSILLFWLPGFGGLIAGIVGGMKSGGIINGVIAAILPSIIFGIALFAATTLLSGMPVLGIVAGMGGFVLVVLHVVPMIIGAIIGGIIG